MRFIFWTSLARGGIEGSILTSVAFCSLVSRVIIVLMFLTSFSFLFRFYFLFSIQFSFSLLPVLENVLFLTEFLLVLAFLINFVWKARMRKIRICNTIKTWNFLKAADSQSCIQRVENRQKLEQFYFSP